MGPKFSRIVGKKNHFLKVSSNLKQDVVCPFCEKTFTSKFTYKQLNAHLRTCNNNMVQQKCEEYFDSTDEKDKLKFYSRVEEYLKKRKNFKKKKSEISFENKISELKVQIQKRKISWEKGCCQIDISRQGLLRQSIEKIKEVDLYKELKINFIGEVSYDAGGLIREWFTIVFESLESSQLHLFIASDTNEFSYTINPFLLSTDTNLEYFNFIGKLIGKALLDNITINACFNKLIYKLLLEENISFEDIVFIDTPLYHSLKKLKELPENFDVSTLNLYYSIDTKDSKGNTHTINLIDNGKNTIVTNVDDYIEKRINFICGSIFVFVEEIQKGLFSLLPKESITHFTSDEFELLVNGRPFIDIEEWKENTEYGPPYTENHQVIKWFWEILESLTQKQLSNLLQFCTGSARVPIGGFAVLESNRSTRARFKIIQVGYYDGRKNYIKAHTCFNRIEVPLFPTKDLLKEAIEFVADNEILGFGID